MKHSYREKPTASRHSDFSARPSIVEIISQYTTLRKSGANYIGLCPLHSEKTPSFTVNDDKGVFYCHGFHEGGDVIRFIELIEHLDFKGALAHLGMSREKISSREVSRRIMLKAASESLALWASDMSIRISARIREAGSRAHLARKVLRELPSADKELLQAEIEDCAEQWEILATLQEDLFNPGYTLDLWRNREAIEKIAGSAA